MTHQPINIAILGASGYTGAELIRLLLAHPNAEIKALSADSQAGQPLGEIFHHLAKVDLPDLVKVDQIDMSGIDLVFCCLPHGTTQEIIAGLPNNVKVIDLSADFRLYDLEMYAQWYGHAHQAPDLQKEAVYGLTEYQRGAIKEARLVANPGCYPTCSLLPLIPLLKVGIIKPDSIIIDAKSGVTGAGRAAKRNLIYSEVSEGMAAYAVGAHRHIPEIEQGLANLANVSTRVNFSPHLIPMRRGMLATIYARLAKGSTSDVRTAWQHAYDKEPFIEIMEEGKTPSTHAVRGSNQCQIAVFKGRSEEDVILISTIDNLVKGASGQAVQNMNVMYGWEEIMGLTNTSLFP